MALLRKLIPPSTLVKSFAPWGVLIQHRPSTKEWLRSWTKVRTSLSCFEICLTFRWACQRFKNVVLHLSLKTELRSDLFSYPCLAFIFFISWKWGQPGFMWINDWYVSYWLSYNRLRTKSHTENMHLMVDNQTFTIGWV